MLSAEDQNQILELVTDPKGNPPDQFMCAPDVIQEKEWGKIIPNIPVRMNSYFQPGAWALYTCGKIIASSKER